MSVKQSRRDLCLNKAISDGKCMWETVTAFFEKTVTTYSYN